LCAAIGFVSSCFIKKIYKPIQVSESQDADRLTIKLSKYQLGRLIYIATALGVMQVLTGIDANLIYASHILKSLFDSPKSGIFGSIIFGSTGVLCCIITALFVEKFKRRIMMTIGVLGCVVFNFGLAITYLLKGP
jgi:hypothetical protein